ncbi:MAG: HAD family hydrolase [Treponemataceae bacterium]|nr:HAD family hydrolase [Treponemataceae bacterium]
MIENFDAVIFDFDGTLYDFRRLPLKIVLNSPLNIFRIKAERDARKKLKGIDFNDSEHFKDAFVAEFCRLTGLSSEIAFKWCFVDGPANMLDVLKKNYKCRDTAPAVFDKLYQAGIKTAVISDYGFVEERMEAVGFSKGICNKLFSAEGAGALKPCPRPFLEIASSLGVEPERCLVVGDRNDTDGEGARRSGMKFVQIITHKTKTVDFAAGHPVIVWDDFADSVLDG